MTPTALTPAGRGNRAQPRDGSDRRPPVSPRAVTSVAEGARTAVQGARHAAQGARTTAQGARTTAQGARTTAQGARTTAEGARAMVQGARTVAQGARMATQRPTASAPAGGRGTGHRAPVRRSPVPRSPRRVSGPAAPARPARRTTVGRTPASRAPLTARCSAYVRALPDHALLDRIIRGRYWIPLLGVLLVGIVAMQVEVLKLNAGIGRALERSTALQSRNEQLRAAVASEADDQRIESKAAHMGMVMPRPAAIRFLRRHPTTDVVKAIASIHAPDPTGFQAGLAATAAAVAAAAPATPATATGTSTAVTATPTTPATSTGTSTSATGA
jgi:hypothetical protein